MHLQQEFQFDLIIYLNSLEDDMENLQSAGEPQMFVNNFNVSIEPIFNRTTSHCLTVAYMAESNRKQLINFMEHLLWKRHLSRILIIWLEPEFNLMQMEIVFQELFLNGMINVLLWFQQTLYTYKPYPQLEVIKMDSFLAYTQRQYLSDFQGFDFYTPFTQFPPRSFSFTDIHGKLVRTGTLYKIVELFVHHYNGNLLISIEENMWNRNFTQELLLEILAATRFDFLSFYVFRDEFYAPSDVLWPLKRYLIVPTAEEIPPSLYILKTFKIITWLMIILQACCVFIIIYWANELHDKRYLRKYYKSSLLQALAIVTFLPYSSHLKLNRAFNVLCLMLNLSIGLMLANCFNCSLSSLWVTKIYKTPLYTLEDIGKTQLTIYDYSLDASMYKQFKLPSIILERLKSNNNEYMQYHRKHLDVHLHAYGSLEDVAKYYLLQQKYMKKPKAKLLEEAILTSTIYVALRHRAPFFDHFNRYLLYIKESGIVHKLIGDSEWDGIRMGDIEFFPYEEGNKSLSLEYLYFGFCVLVAGLVMAMVTFLFEIFIESHMKLSVSVM